MGACSGTLVVHEDGTPVWCSEELGGRVCGDRSYERHRSFQSCRVALRLGCPECVGATLAEAHVPRAQAGMV